MTSRSWAALFVAAAACRSADARPETRTTLVGSAIVPDFALDRPIHGRVRMIVRGIGDISDDCPDADSRMFVSELDGDMVLDPDGSFEAQLYPFSPTVATPSGCPVTRVDVERIEGITIVAGLPTLRREAIGWLDFQTLSSVDNGELQSGNFGQLYTTLYFPAPTPAVIPPLRS